MKILFCDSGFSPKEVDYMYQEEYDAAKKQGVAVALISFEALKKGRVQEALKRIRGNEDETLAIYRGWMLSADLYQLFYEALLERNIRLINTPEEYAFCHYLPNSYEAIKNFTPKTIFRPLETPFDIDAYKDDLAVFGEQAIIVKDYVKSQKHYWEEACFIPNASDWENVETVTKRFIELQDVDLNIGLVYREFVALQALTEHSVSGMPLTKEFRVFVKEGRIMQCFNYWDEGDYGDATVDVNFLKTIIPKIKSQFFTIDVAQTKKGEWIIVELGDGQVSGFPEMVDKISFYSDLTV